MDDFKNEQNGIPEKEENQINHIENEAVQQEKKSTAAEIESRILSSRMVRAENAMREQNEISQTQEAEKELQDATEQTAQMISEQMAQTPLSEAEEQADLPKMEAGYASAQQNEATPYEEPKQGEIPQAPSRPMYSTTPPNSWKNEAAQAQNEWTNTTTPPKVQPKKNSKTGKYVAVSLAAICGAVLLFAAGAQIGRAVSNGSNDGGAASVFGSDDMPVVNVSGTPNLDPDNYDVVNGLAGEEVYKKVNPSIVSVISTSVKTGGGTGSGVIMSEDGYIITNQHVVADADMVSVVLEDGTKLNAEIVGTDEKTDLAVLKVETKEELTAAEFGDSDALQPGEYAYAIGSPGGIELANTITGGRISAINRDVTIDDRVMTLIQTDASINPGNSGGALINKYGQVVGITSAKLGIGAYEGLGFAIPISTAKEIIDTLISNGYVTGRPSIGITGYNISEENAAASKVPQGVYVESVDKRAHAASEGLQAKDIITEVNEQTITTMDEINEIKKECKAGDVLKIKVYRMTEGKYVSLKITLTDEHDLAAETEEPAEEETDPYEEYYNYYGGNQSENPFSYFFGN